MRSFCSAVLCATFAVSTSCTGRIAGTGGDSLAHDDSGGQGGDDAQAGGGSAGASAAAVVSSGARLSRLTHFQWQNAVRDLLRLKTLPVVPQLQADAVQGFDNNNAGPALDVSLELRSDYEQASESIARALVADATAVAALVPKTAPSDFEGKSRAVIRALAERAYRRPLRGDEDRALWDLFSQGPSLVNNTDRFKAGLEVLVGALLQSPMFVYRVELGEGENTDDFSLTPFELATRLAFALTDTMPDDELFEAARAGRLKTADEVERQASRLLQSDAAKASGRHFHEQLFRMAAYDRISKDPKSFPTFSPDLPQLMKEESLRFLDDILADERPAEAILNGDTSFVNAKLAALYDVSGSFDDGFKKTTLNTKQRRGLLTQAGFLAANADAHNPDPIHRGVFISHVLLCKVLPPPAMNASPVPVSETKTNRQRVEAHTGKGTCGAGCHATLINPLGYAFESFDAMGRYRTKDNGADVDASGEYGELSEGPIRFSDGIELSEQLSHSRDFHECYFDNWLQYLWAREPHEGDSVALAASVKASLDGQSVRDVLMAMITSPSFRRFVR